MNRIPKKGLTHWWFAAALVLMTLSVAGLSAEPVKRPSSVAPPVGGGTIATYLSCMPTSGTLPLNIHIFSTTYNLTDAPRFCFGRVDLQTAGGLYLASISSGTITLPAGQGEFVQVGWFKPLPARIYYFGLNRYFLTITDISAPPYNQPPYPPSGYSATAECEVNGIIP